MTRNPDQVRRNVCKGKKVWSGMQDQALPICFRCTLDVDGRNHSHHPQVISYDRTENCTADARWMVAFDIPSSRSKVLELSFIPHAFWWRKIPLQRANADPNSRPESGRGIPADTGTVSRKGNAQHYINPFIAHISTTTSPHIKIKGSVESQISVVYYGTLKKWIGSMHSQ